MFPKKGIFSLQLKIIIEISLGNKFQLKLTTVIFCNIFAQKGYFKPETEKVTTTIELFIFQLD